MENIFEQLEHAHRELGAEATLDRLLEFLRREQRPHELFEAMKLRVRIGLGLPLLANDLGDELPEVQREALEAGLLDACREVGMMCWKAGRLRDGWHYLRAVSDQAFTKAELAKVEPTQENLDEFLEICIHEGLDLQRGFQLLIDHYGTCNTITTYESAMYGRPRAQRAVGAALLLEHVYGELLANVRGHIEREQSAPAAGASLIELITDRDWLFANGSYHLDTTHLASVVRLARDISDPTLWQQAFALTEYGRRLSTDLQYPGDAPFESLYEASGRYFQALMGRDRDVHLAYFRERAEQSDPRQDTTIAIEVYVDLLARIGRSDEALGEALRLLPDDVPQTGRAPSLLELASACGSFERLRELARRRNDPLGFALSLLEPRVT